MAAIASAAASGVLKKGIPFSGRDLIQGSSQGAEVLAVLQITMPVKDVVA